VEAVIGKNSYAEVIYSRADAEKDFMGLMTFSGSRPYLWAAHLDRILTMSGENLLLGAGSVSHE